MVCAARPEVVLRLYGANENCSEAVRWNVMARPAAFLAGATGEIGKRLLPMRVSAAQTPDRKCEGGDDSE